jgi:hypothetical protein
MDSRFYVYGQLFEGFVMAFHTRRSFLSGLLGYSAASLLASRTILGAGNSDTPYISVTVYWSSRSTRRAGVAVDAFVRLIRVRDGRVERQGRTDAKGKIYWPRLPVGNVYRLDVTYQGFKGDHRVNYGHTKTIPGGRIGFEHTNRGVQVGGMFHQSVFVDMP